MKRILRVLVLILFSMLLTACSNKEISPLLFKDNNDDDNKNNINLTSTNADSNRLDYTIDKITLSKNYQSIEPNIEIIKSGLDFNLLLSLGIVNSSGIYIENIEKNDRDVNIYIHNEKNYLKDEFVVPQIVLHFDNLSIKDLETLNFKIINKNYEPLKSNIDISEAVSKIKSSLKIDTSTFPSSSIVKKDNNIFLDLNFTNAVDLENKKNPIINLNVLIDLVNGNIVESTKSPVSSLIDEGDIIEYVTNEYIFYIKEEIDKVSTNYNLWMYDIKKNSKEKIYTSRKKISSFKFNKDLNKALLVEESEDYNRLKLLDLGNLNIYKTNLDKNINPCISIWKDDEILIVDKKNPNAQIYAFNILNNESKFLCNIDKDIKQIQYLDGNFLFTIVNDDIKDIYITKDFKENTLIDSGENPLFINNDTICYLNSKNNSGKNILWFYYLKDGSIKNYTDINVKDFFIWKDNLAIIEKNHIGSDNPLYIYNLKNENKKFVTSVKTDKIFLNTDTDILYINSSVDVKKDKTSVISFIKLEN